MNTCHECVNVVEKLNQEFNELQDKYDKLVEKQIDFDYYKKYWIIMSKFRNYYYSKRRIQCLDDLLKNINSLDDDLKDMALEIFIEEKNENYTKIWNEKKLMNYYKSINLIGDIHKCNIDYKNRFADIGARPDEENVFVHELPWNEKKYLVLDFR